jgi:hypothetical protein
VIGLFDFDKMYASGDRITTRGNVSIITGSA